VHAENKKTHGTNARSSSAISSRDQRKVTEKERRALLLQKKNEQDGGAEYGRSADCTEGECEEKTRVAEKSRHRKKEKGISKGGVGVETTMGTASTALDHIDAASGRKIKSREHRVERFRRHDRASFYSRRNRAERESRGERLNDWGKGHCSALRLSVSIYQQSTLSKFPGKGENFNGEE